MIICLDPCKQLEINKQPDYKGNSQSNFKSNIQLQEMQTFLF